MDETIRASVMKSCPIIHDSVTKASEKFKKVMNRINYVTPTSYLELIKTFTGQLFANLEKVEKARMRYVVGLEKLDFRRKKCKCNARGVDSIASNTRPSKERYRCTYGPN